MIRVPPLATACNFRDFGGYPAGDGGRVRWARLFRSGALARLSPDDLAYVRSLDVRAVLDLRRADERESFPNPVLGARVVERHWTEPGDASPLRGRSFSGSVSRSDARRAMISMYARMPGLLRSRIRGVFGGLLEAAGGPAILHCTIGKDRTGLAAALVLTALGVPREFIIEDYLLTNTVVDLAARVETSDGSGLGLAQSSQPLLALPPDVRAVVLAADADYLLASLRSIEEAHGSVDAYLAAEIGVDAEARMRLTEALLQ